MKLNRQYMRFAAGVLACCTLLGGADPEQFRAKVGVYAWGQLRKTADPLPTAVSDVKSLGAKVFRTTISPYWDPRGIEDLRQLDEKMKRPDYQAALRAFPVIMLTAYDAASYYARYRDAIETSPQPLPATPQSTQHDKFGGWFLQTASATRGGPLTRYAPASWAYAGALSTAMSRTEWRELLKKVESEFYRFAYELSKIRGVKFIISNWEAENDATDEIWPQYLEYIQARLNGTIAGRDAAWLEGHPAEVYTAFEFRHIRSGAKDPWAKTPPRKFAGLDSALRELSGVEYLSYSSWSSISHSEKPGYNAVQLQSAFRDMRSACEDTANPCRIIIGETGYLWDHDPEGTNFESVLDTCLREGAEYVFNWCAYDQPGQSDPYGFKVDLSKWGKFTVSGDLTPQGKSMRMLYQATTEAPAVPGRTGTAPASQPH